MPSGTRNSQPLRHSSHSSDEGGSTTTFHLNIFYETTEPHMKIRKCKTNCRNVEIPILYPSRSMTSLSEVADEACIPVIGNILANQPAGNADSSPTSADANNFEARANSAFHVPASPSLLNLPIEIRLEIYSYLLPSQIHTITTQYPHNGSYYSSTPEYSTRTLYAPACLPSTSVSNFSRSNLTTYSIPRRDTPIYPEILRVCKQTYSEAEPVLYGSKGVEFNFGTYLDALIPFLQDRSLCARESIRNIRIAMDIPKFTLMDGIFGDRMVHTALAAKPGKQWKEICEFLGGEFKMLRGVNLVVWGDFGKIMEGKEDLGLGDELTPALGVHDAVPATVTNTPSFGELDGGHTSLRKTSDAEIREWEWVRELLSLDTFRNTGVNWWNFGDEEDSDVEGENEFRTWMAKRMVGETGCSKARSRFHRTT